MLLSLKYYSICKLCFKTGQGAMGTNWSIGSSIWTWGRISSLWGWRSTGTGCPGRLWSLLLWRYSTLAWTRSYAACCRQPCFGRRVELDDPQRSLPTSTILWFCDLKSNYYCYMSVLKNVSTNVLQGLLLCPGLSTVFINILEDEIRSSY